MASPKPVTQPKPAASTAIGIKPVTTPAKTPTTTKIPAVIAKPTTTTNYVGSGLYSPGNAGSGPATTKSTSGTTKSTSDTTKTTTDDGGLSDDLLRQLDDLRRQMEELAKGQNQEDPSLAYAKAMAEKDRQDAFENLKVVFESYGMSSLSDTITRIMRSGATANEAIVKLKYDKTIDPATGKAWNAAYTLRFAGNEKRLGAGLNALSEAEYINLEDSYANTLKSYGLGNMLTTSRETNEAMLAKYIGADISATEFKDRIQTVEDRVVNADPSTKALFKDWYPNITDSDLVQYFLDPATTIGKLKEKATAAEIGAAAKGQGLQALKTNAEGLATYGVDRATALQGYQNIGEVLPVSQQLSSIYKAAGIEYNQTVGEEEFFKGNAKAAEQRKRLKSLERASFSGESGVGANSLNRAAQGSF